MNNGANQQDEKVGNGAGTPDNNHNHHNHNLINNLSLTSQGVNNTSQVKIKHTQEGITNGYNIMVFNQKIPIWFGANASTYKAKADRLSEILSQYPNLNYGILLGKQLKDFYVVCIDIDIDTEDCKEKLSKEIERLLNKHEIKFYKELTKSKRIHYYIVLDKTTEKIESISKLSYIENCFKVKDGKEVKGEIELLTKNKAVVVYDKEPFFTKEPLINYHKIFENFLEDWEKVFKPEELEKESKEAVKEPEKKTKKEHKNKTKKKNKLQFSKIVESLKILKNLGFLNGWEADKTLSGIGIREGISEEEIIEGFKTVWGSEYDEKYSRYLTELTKKKNKERIPGIGSFIHYVREALKTDRLNEYETELLKAVLNDLKSNGYNDIPEKTLRNWELENDGWYMYCEDGEYIQVLPYFEITSHFLINGEEYIEITDKKGNTYIKKVERKKDSYLPDVSIVKDFGVINPDRVKDAKKFLAHYIEKVKAEKGVKVDFIGYKYITNNDWDVVVAGDGYSRKELGYIFYGKEVSNRWFIPEIKGNPEEFKRVFKELFYLNDEPLHLVISHFLTWIGKEFLKEDIYLENNPILALIGDTGTGKSVRIKISTALYGNPALFSYTNMTQAGLNNRFPLLKVAFGIDEVVIRTFEDFLRFEKIFYNITNEQGKIISNGTYDPIEVPIAITGETENMQIDKLLDRGRGLNRRLIVIKMTDTWKENSEVLDNALDKLQLHHGYILGYVKSLKEEDKKEVIDLMKGIQARLHFGDSSFKDLKKHLALSFAMYFHFYEHYIRMDAGDVAEKVNAVIDFVAEQINNNQATRIGENTDYIGEIINFIAKVEEAINNRKVLKNKTYPSLCSDIGFI
ncbi:MAG: DUF927 domain-containing protein, partial [Sulfurihydrogenibium sp.]|nr:DUF927 domain-containing protein [Sulfurihydrogenibium sp.]